MTEFTTEAQRRREKPRDKLLDLIFSVALCLCGELVLMLKMTRDIYDALRQHGEETYPHECCGVLLGQMDDDGTRIVTSAVRAWQYTH